MQSDQLLRMMGPAVLLVGALFISACSESTGNTLTGNVLAIDSVRTWEGCSETDKNALGNGKNPALAGTATVKYKRQGSTVNSLIKSDYCSGKRVFEFYCLGKKMYYESISCEQLGKGYTCKDNACVKTR